MILITGASGLLGSQLVKKLASTDKETKVVTIYNHHIPKEQWENVIYIKCNLLDHSAVEDLFQNFKITYVYHCAAIVSFNAVDKYKVIEQNVAITAQLVDLSIEYDVLRFIHVSSIAAIGREQQLSDNKLLHEGLIWQMKKNVSAYAQSKFYAEMEVWRGFAEGLRGAIINPGIILGENYWNNSSGKLFSTVAQGLKWYTKGITAYVDVSDVVKAMILLAESNIHEERFIISQGNYSYEEIFNKIAQYLKVSPPQKYATKSQSDIIWRLFWVKEKITGKKALITKETAHTAHSVYTFDNTKFLKFFPEFKYKDINNTIERIAKQYLQQY